MALLKFVLPPCRRSIFLVKLGSPCSQTEPQVEIRSWAKEHMILVKLVKKGNLGSGVDQIMTPSSFNHSNLPVRTRSGQGVPTGIDQCVPRASLNFSLWVEILHQIQLNGNQHSSLDYCNPFLYLGQCQDRHSLRPAIHQGHSRADLSGFLTSTLRWGFSPSELLGYSPPYHFGAALTRPCWGHGITCRACFGLGHCHLEDVNCQ